jgi:hypothetical protein
MEEKQSALQRVLKATTTLPARVTFYASALGAIALVPQADLPPALAALAGGVGVNALSSILERVARGEPVDDEEIRRQVQAAIEESDIERLLTADEFQRAVARLARWHDVLRYAVRSSEFAIVERLVEQGQRYEALVVGLGDEIRASLETLATREQANEILALLRRRTEASEESPGQQVVQDSQYVAQADRGGISIIHVHTPLPDTTRPRRPERHPEPVERTAEGAAYPPNPFTPLSGRIDDPERVFDREREIARALERLQAGSSVALIGPAGVGKSSLLTKLMTLAVERLGPDWEGTYLDLQSVHDEGDFYEALCSELGIATCRGYHLDRTLRERCAQQGRRTLLCLDEFEAMTWEGFGHGLRAQLRGLAEGSDAPLKLILAARTSLDRLFPDSERMTSFFGSSRSGA